MGRYYDPVHWRTDQPSIALPTASTALDISRGTTCDKRGDLTAAVRKVDTEQSDLLVQPPVPAEVGPGRQDTAVEQQLEEPQRLRDTQRRRRRHRRHLTRVTVTVTVTVTLTLTVRLLRLQQLSELL